MDDCSSRVDWNPVEVGQSHSQLAAVIAGFLFTGVVFLLGRPRPNTNDSYPYVLMIPSFFILLLDSFLFSVISGEQVCNRAWTETMIAAGLLGAGSLGIFGGLAWVVYNVRPGQREPLSIVLATSHLIAIVILLHLQTTTVYYLRDLYPDDGMPDWLTMTTWLITGCVLGLLIAASVLRWLRPHKRMQVHAAAYCALLYGISCSVAFSVLGGRPRAEWEPTPNWIAVTSVLLALTTSGVAVATQIAALPTTKSSSATRR
ncbi:hypothetical protein [Actinoplanes sp. DH11]|uniref:hypothetical protein n=1 Tax=Actinoplanes sp. DH11 TaxID=2857011 RepID=UPI001E2CFAB9|nr:hypothetical protein [Actinoplanes sp. DH11]